MSEKTSSTPEKETFQNPEMIQFKDGQIVIGFRTPGDVIHWEGHSSSRHLDSSARNTALVVLEGGRYIALGGKVALMLPEWDKQAGKFGKPGEKVHGTTLKELAPNGLPDATIGQPWDVIDPKDPVKEVYLDWKSTTPNSPMAEHQIPTTNPFDSARAIIDRFAEAALNQ